MWSSFVKEFQRSGMILHEVRITFGKQKRRDGGDVRSNFAALHKLCVVKALATLFIRRKLTDPS